MGEKDGFSLSNLSESEQSRVAAKITSSLFFLKIMERMVYGKDQWGIKINGNVYPGIIVFNTRIGVQIYPYIPESITCSPILLCNQEEVMYHHDITLPPHVSTFFWWLGVSI